MSYQLVHTRPERAASGGSITSSGDIPGALELVLGTLPSGNDGTAYSYRVMELAGKTYHIFSRACTWAKEGSPQRLTHHLALTEEEASALTRHEACPTPSGIMLALGKQGFWLEQMQPGNEPALNTAPKLSATQLPDASLQPTWKELTGHKDNARSFYTPPYDGACLALLPPHTAAETILLLFHESDWLTPGLGWGRTFTTGGSMQDSFEATQRIAVPIDSLPTEWARSSKAAVLRIDASLVLPPEISAPAPEAERMEPPPPAEEEQQPLFPYAYAECADEEVYNVSANKRHQQRRIVALLLLALLGTCLYGTIFGGGDDVKDAARQAIRHYNTSENADTLRQLLELPYSPQVARQKLAKLSRHLNQPEGEDEENERVSRLHECVELLRNARLRVSGHASVLQQLMEAAELLDLPEDRLATFYLCEATHGKDATAWRLAQNAPAERAAWRALAERYPEAWLWAEEPMLAAYLQGLFADTPAQPHRSTP